MTKYVWIHEHRHEHSVRTMCQQLGVSTSGYYKWRATIQNPVPTKNEMIFEKIVDIHAKSRGVYGSPRVHQALLNEGIHCNHKRVERIMKERGLRATQSKKFKPTTNSKYNLPIAKNVLARDFSKKAPNEGWVSDITYVWTAEGWLYLVVFIDLWSRRVLGWSMSERMQAEFVRDAFEMACAKSTKSLENLLVHSDRGSQYASDLFRKALRRRGSEQSMSRKANCWDNAVAESFLHQSKKSSCIMFHSKRGNRHEQPFLTTSRFFTTEFGYTHR